MSPEVIEQVRTVASALDRRSPSLTVQEIVAAPQTETLVTVLKGRSHSRGVRPWVAAAAAVIAMVGLGGVVSMRKTAEVEPRDSGATPALTDDSAPSSSTVTSLVDEGLPDGMPPAGSVLRTSFDSTVGEFRVFDDIASDRTCLIVFQIDGTTGGCFPKSDVEAGNAYVWSSDRPGVLPGLVFGLAPSSGEFSVIVDGALVLPDEHRIWFSELPVGLTSFIVNGPTGPQSIEISAVSQPETVAAGTRTP